MEWSGNKKSQRPVIKCWTPGCWASKAAQKGITIHPKAHNAPHTLKPCFSTRFINCFGKDSFSSPLYRQLNCRKCNEFYLLCECNIITGQKSNKNRPKEMPEFRKPLPGDFNVKIYLKSDFFEVFWNFVKRNCPRTSINCSVLPQNYPHEATQQKKP